MLMIMVSSSPATMSGAEARRSASVSLRRNVAPTSRSSSFGVQLAARAQLLAALEGLAGVFVADDGGHRASGAALNCTGMRPTS